MSFDYAKMEDTAQRLIDLFGESATLHVRSNSGTAWQPTVTETNTSVRCVSIQKERTDSQGVAMYAQRLLISTAAAVTPSVGDAITVGSVKHEISDVVPVSPGGDVILWSVGLVA